MIGRLKVLEATKLLMVEGSGVFQSDPSHIMNGTRGPT